MHNEQTPSISELEKTVSRPVSFIGVGLHTGRKVAMQIKPVAAGTGIHFQRKDVGLFLAMADRIRCRSAAGMNGWRASSLPPRSSVAAASRGTASPGRATDDS